MSRRECPARVLGVDGKTYPAVRLHADTRTSVISHAHYLLHHDGLSIRQIRARLADELDIQRSVGWLHNVLTTWRCEECPAVQVAQKCTPEHPEATP